MLRGRHAWISSALTSFPYWVLSAYLTDVRAFTEGELLLCNSLFFNLVSALRFCFNGRDQPTPSHTCLGGNSVATLHSQCLTFCSTPWHNILFNHGTNCYRMSWTLIISVGFISCQANLWKKGHWKVSSTKEDYGREILLSHRWLDREGSFSTCLFLITTCPRIYCWLWFYARYWTSETLILIKISFWCHLASNIWLVDFFVVEILFPVIFAKYCLNSLGFFKLSLIFTL